MSRYLDWFENVTPDDYPERAPLERDPDELGDVPVYKHKPCSQQEFMGSIEQAKRDAREYAALIAAGDGTASDVDTVEVPIINFRIRQAS